MKSETWYRLLLTAFCVCFAFLLVHGAGRLIGESDAAPVAAFQVPYTVALDRAADAQQISVRLVRRETDVQQRAYCRSCGMGAASAAVELRCDSNGNVLLHRSYMHAVYQAFALGDGFA